MMRRFFIRHKLPVFFAILACVIALNFASENIRNFFTVVSLPIQKKVWNTSGSLSALGANIMRAGSLGAENQRLLEENLSLKARIFDEQAVQKENADMREALGGDARKKFHTMMAEAVAREVANDVIVIDRGSESGIKKGMPVISSSKVLVGVVTETFPTFSKVALISRRGTVFDGIIAAKGVIGALKGQGDSRAILDLIPQNANVENGDIVLTGKISGYPEGLLIGEITKLRKNDVDPFQQADLKLFYTINIIQEPLFVMVSSRL